MFVSFFFLVFFLPFFLFVFFVTLFVFFIGCTYNTMGMFLVLFGNHGYVPVVVWLLVIRDGLPQPASTVPLTGWHGTAAVRTLSHLFVFSHRYAFLLQPVFVAAGKRANV